jgi:hypothetical protein|tara:strand:+ start:242 stop:460 length:219 start_codon:yes stop_codon:yes gene_type:complete
MSDNIEQKSIEWVTIGSVWKNEVNMNGKIDLSKIIDFDKNKKYTISLNINKYKKENKHPDFNIRLKLINIEE